MKYIYRDITVFEYFDGEVIQHNRVDGKPAFDCCRWTAEACKSLAEFFDLVARHKNGEDVELKDIHATDPPITARHIYKLESEATTVIINTPDPQGRTGMHIS